MSRNCRFLSTMEPKTSGSAAQVVDERIDGGGLGLHHPELRQEGAQVAGDLLGPGAGGCGNVPLEQRLEVLHVRLHGLGMYAADVDELVVVAVDEIALEVEYVGEAAGEAGPEVDPGAPKHAYRSTRHVLAAVIAGTFDHRYRARVAHRETLAGHPGGIQLPARGTVQAGVAHDDGVARRKARARRMAQHDPAGGHAFADIVVGIALEIEMQPAGVPHAEALPGVATAAHHDRCLLHAVVAPAAGDLARDACA